MKFLIPNWVSAEKLRRVEDWSISNGAKGKIRADFNDSAFLVMLYLIICHLCAKIVNYVYLLEISKALSRKHLTVTTFIKVLLVATI
jgi:hypothetical protein